jgi:hypothetical protein
MKSFNPFNRLFKGRKPEIPSESDSPPPIVDVPLMPVNAPPTEYVLTEEESTQINNMGSMFEHIDGFIAGVIAMDKDKNNTTEMWEFDRNKLSKLKQPEVDSAISNARRKCFEYIYRFLIGNKFSDLYNAAYTEHHKIRFSHIECELIKMDSKSITINDRDAQPKDFNVCDPVLQIVQSNDTVGLPNKYEELFIKKLYVNLFNLQNKEQKYFTISGNYFASVNNPKIIPVKDAEFNITNTTENSITIKSNPILSGNATRVFEITVSIGSDGKPANILGSVTINKGNTGDIPWQRLALLLRKFVFDSAVTSTGGNSITCPLGERYKIQRRTLNLRKNRKHKTRRPKIVKHSSRKHKKRTHRRK